MQAHPKSRWPAYPAYIAGFSAFCMVLFASLCDCLAAGPEETATDSLNASAAALALSTTPVDVPVPDAFGLIMKMGISLLAVLVVIWVAVQVIRRLPGRAGTGVRRSCVRVVDRTYLAPKKTICIVQIGSRYMALGVTESQISALGDLDEEDVQHPVQADSEGSAQVPFANLFRDVRARLAGGPREDAS